MENTLFHSHSFEEPGIHIFPLQIQSFADSPFRATP